MKRNLGWLSVCSVVILASGCTAILGIGEPGASGPDGAPADAAPADAGAPFSLGFDPDLPHAVRGGPVFRTVRLTRDAGFTAAITVTVLDLPGGVGTMPLTIASGATTGQLQLSAPADATLGPVEVRLHGEGGGEIADFPAVVMIADRPGSLDVSFGTGGLVVVPGTGTRARGVAVQPDGRIVVAGDGGQIVRLREDGALDADFGTGGLVASGDSSLVSMALVPGGRLLVAGSGGGDGGGSFFATVRRFEANGSPDDGYGVAGIAKLDGHLVNNMAADAFGNALLCGSTQVLTFHVVRYGTDGMKDGNFAGSGQFTADGLANVEGVAARPDLSFVVFGGISSASLHGVYVVSLDNAGIPQPSFGANGIATIGIDGDQARAATFDADGNVVLAGRLGNESPAERQVLVGRLLAADGAADPGFDDDGLNGFSFGLPGAEGRGVVRQRDGKLVVAAVGNLGTVIAGSMALQGGALRVNPNGTLDLGFDLDGQATLNDGMGNIFDGVDIRAVALAPDGRIVLVGGKTDDSGYLVVRLWD